MGLGAFRTAWKRQVKYFGHDAGRGQRFTNVVFDNRGIGDSGKPVCRYSSREMAGDVVEVLGGLGWVDGNIVKEVMGGFYGKLRGESTVDGDGPVEGKRDIVVVGVSMGGMIAQELALLIPGCIKALFLVSTCPRLVRTIPWLENLRQRINMFVPRSIDVQLEENAYRMFSPRFLEMKDTENEEHEMNFPTVRDRFAAAELAKRMDKERFTRMGFVCQALAAGWHHKSKEQLQEMVKKIGGERICILHGTGDEMLVFRHFELFKEDIGEDKGVEFKVWEGAGHVLGWEHEVEFNQFIEQAIQRIEEGRK